MSVNEVSEYVRERRTGGRRFYWNIILCETKGSGGKKIPHAFQQGG
jgi:hypothetical protein